MAWYSVRVIGDAPEARRDRDRPVLLDVRVEADSEYDALRVAGEAYEVER